MTCLFIRIVRFMQNKIKKMIQAYKILGKILFFNDSAAYFYVSYELDWNYIFIL